MVIAKAEYSRKFISETTEKCVHPDGSGIYIKVQKINVEDEQTRKKIEKTFVLNSSNEEKRGFDGNILYVFGIKDDLYLSSCQDESRNTEYTTTVKIEKAGSKEMVGKLSDLEEFLLEKEFQQPQE